MFEEKKHQNVGCKTHNPLSFFGYNKVQKKKLKGKNCFKEPSK